MTRIRWDRLYAKHFPHRTDATSRHVALIAQRMRDRRSVLHRLLDEAGYEPEEMAEALEITVKMLWETRELAEKAGVDPFPNRGKAKAALEAAFKEGK